MKLYRLLTEDDTSAFCHKVTAALNKGWALHGSPAYGFGTANRSNMAKRFISDEHVKKGGIHQKDNPSPCAYTIRPVATGIQSEAKTRSQPSWRFGTQKRFDTAARDRMQATPGPGAYLI